MRLRLISTILGWGDIPDDDTVAGPDATPFADGMGAAESLVWTWKDQLPEAGYAWSGRFVHRRASLLSPRLLAALYPGQSKQD